MFFKNFASAKKVFFYKKYKTLETIWRFFVHANYIKMNSVSMGWYVFQYRTKSLRDRKFKISTFD